MGTYILTSCLCLQKVNFICLQALCSFREYGCMYFWLFTFAEDVDLYVVLLFTVSECVDMCVEELFTFT